jgi:uncharacterized membrane protein
MSTRAKALGHPIHPALVVFPLGLLATAVGLDVVNAFSGNPVLGQVAFWNIGIGIVSGLIAAAFGFWDWLGIPTGTRAKRIGMLHGLGNVVVVLLFATVWLLRRDIAFHVAPAGALWLEVIAGGLSLVTGWLGGELVDRLGVGVDAGAHVNAPSSLRTSSVR